MANVTLDAVDAVELAEILELFMQRIDVLAEHDLAAFFFSECSTHGIDDLRADVAWLIHRLYTSHMFPPGSLPGTDSPRAPIWSPVLPAPWARPDNAARAASMASAGSDLPVRRRACPFGRSTSTTSTPELRRNMGRQARYVPAWPRRSRLRGRPRWPRGLEPGWRAPVAEYQYYEFLAVDRPLDAHQLAELRALSTRARISPSRFVNTYQWGDCFAIRSATRRITPIYDPVPTIVA